MNRLKENLGAAEITFTAQELSELDTALSKIEIYGDRYPSYLEKNVGN